MIHSSTIRWAIGLLAAASMIMVWASVQVAGQAAVELKADDPVQTLVVKIDVGGNVELAEPVALDLGLGFPFWLHPIGRNEKETAPFGVVPGEATTQAKVAPGSSAMFTFSLGTDPGQDVFRTTSQLLAGVRASDISRIGFAGGVNTDWVLDGYEIQINGQPFASKKAIGQSAKKTLDAARTKLDELNKKIAPLESEQANLNNLANTKLATADDLKRLDEIKADLGSLTAEKVRLSGQLQGTYPWFVDPDFQSPWRDKSAAPAAKTMKVVLVTANHSAAATGNYVYFQTGGHKYLMGSPTTPLTPAGGPQTFTLNLAAGPLAAADLRGWAVGMLGTAQPYGRAPDRWHPERILVVVDGRATYDSDENALDRNSLKAVRLIPPAHVDKDGTMIVDAPISRETFLWEAGKGQGLDLATGSPQSLPAADDPNAPQPEPGTVPAADTSADNNPPIPTDVVPFPGENSGTNPDVVVNVQPGNDDMGGGGSWNGGDGGWNGGDGGWNGGDGGNGGGGDIIPPDPGPQPVGVPFQIKSVAITCGYQTLDTFTIKWDVEGNEGDIDHYLVYLYQIWPEKPPGNQYDVTTPLLVQPFPAGMHEITAKLTTLPQNPLGAAYLFPMVVGVPVDPTTMTPNQRIGPARALFSSDNADKLIANSLQLMPNFYYVDGSGMHYQSIYHGMPQPGTDVAVCQVDQLDSSAGIAFDKADPGINVYVRPNQTTTWFQVDFRATGLFYKDIQPTGVCVLVGHAGFAGGAGMSNSATFRGRGTIKRLPRPGDVGLTQGIPPVISPPPTPLLDPSTPPNQKLLFCQQDINMAPVYSAATNLDTYEINYSIQFQFPAGVSQNNFAYPPAVYGVRLLRK